MVKHTAMPTIADQEKNSWASFLSLVAMSCYRSNWRNTEPFRLPVLHPVIACMKLISHMRVLFLSIYVQCVSDLVDFVWTLYYYHKILNSHYCLPPTKEEVNAFTRVCLSVSLLARLLKNAWVDLDEILRVDRGLDIDELINFWARSWSKSGSRNRICTGFLHFSGYLKKLWTYLKNLWTDFDDI